MAGLPGTGDYAPGIYPNMTFEQYAAIPAVNPSSVKDRIACTPRGMLVKLRGYKGESSDSLELGTLAHLAILEPDEIPRRCAIWTGAAVLNGTTVGTDSFVLWLFNSEGDLLANTAIAGTLSAGASVFQKIAFGAPITLSPGRYFLGSQLNGATATTRHVLAAFGAEPRCGIVPASASFAASQTALNAAAITVPTSFTTAQAPIMQLYS